MTRTVRQFSSASGVALALVVALTVGVIVLSVLALQRSGAATVSNSNPVPSFDLGVETSVPLESTAEPDPSIPATAVSPAEERFLSIGAQAWWRGVAGQCGAVEPLIERSIDNGQTWIDVTPRYLGVAELLSLNAFTPTEAEMVVKVGGNCEVQALRTFTQGEFWEPNPDVLATSRFVDRVTRGQVDLGQETVPGPCVRSTGVRAWETVVALLCDNSAWVWDSTGWVSLDGPQRALALDVNDEAVWVAGLTPECDGIAVAALGGVTAEPPVAPACVADADPFSPLAIAASGEVVALWSGDEVVRVR